MAAGFVGSSQMSKAQLIETKKTIEWLISEGFLTTPATKVVGSTDATASSLLLFLKKAIASDQWVLDTAQV